jgi:hypothetical protein
MAGYELRPKLSLELDLEKPPRKKSLWQKIIDLLEKLRREDGAVIQVIGKGPPNFVETRRMVLLR